MASFFKRGKKWYYSMDIGVDESGKGKKQSRGGFDKRQDAAAEVLLIEIELSKGKYIQEKNLSFEEFTKMC